MKERYIHIDTSEVTQEMKDNSIIYQKMVNMRKKVYQWTGIPVSIGLGPTKTLAKLANKKKIKTITHIKERSSKRGH